MPHSLRFGATHTSIDGGNLSPPSVPYIHTHILYIQTHTYVQIYIYICVCVYFRTNEDILGILSAGLPPFTESSSISFLGLPYIDIHVHIYIHIYLCICVLYIHT